MRILATTPLVASLLLTALSLPGISQERPGRINSANVTVAADDSFGTPLSNVKVDSFIDEQGRDRVARFHGGSTASEVPFGQYRITVHATDFRQSTFYVDVAARYVPITAGLEWYGVENTRITAELRGKLAGFPSGWGDWRCKASGLYSRLEYESVVTPADLRFNFGEVPPGIWAVACVANRKFIAVRTITIAADAAPFTIDYMSSQDGEAARH
jgi:hypothetical protein